MAVLALGDVWNAEFWFSCQSQYALNVKAFAVVGTVGAGGVPDTVFANDLANVFFPFYQQLMPNIASTFGVQVYRTHPSGTTPTFTVAAFAGTTGVSVMPPQVAALIRFRNASLGRKNKSRLYVPFISATLVGQSGTLTAQGVNRANQLGAEFITSHTVNDAGNAASYELVTRTTPAGAYRFLTMRTVGNQLATMRSRSYIYGSDVAPF